MPIQRKKEAQMRKPNMVILHGWSWKNYSKFGKSDPWESRINFISELRRNFNVHIVIFPGFCGIAEPNKPWGLDDFSEYVKKYLEEKNIHPDFILGYSFGSAVAVKMKERFALKCPIILVSPAIIRSISNRNISLSSFWKRIVPKFLINWIKEIYLCNIVKNQFHKNGTVFLKKTYQEIVRIDLSSELLGFSPEEVVCIFGSNDTSTPPSYLLKKLGNGASASIVKVIDKGEHDIANTHTEELLKIIKNFTHKKGERK